MDNPIKNAETIYVYTSGTFGFAYVGSPVNLIPMGDLSARIHDHECLAVGICDICGMKALAATGCGMCGSLHHVTEEHDILSDTDSDSDWYGI